MMQKELFGVFGGRTAFERVRSSEAFDRVLSSAALTVGIRDPALGVPNRSATYEGSDGICVIWGEVYLPETIENAARWVYERYRERGPNAISALNGSYLVAIAGGGEAAVYTDPIRSWECFYTDVPGVRTFGTDAARVCGAVPTLSLDRESLLELAHISVVLGDRTLFEKVHRTPFDGVLRADDTVSLDRFVYRPRTFDYTAELADRLRRALARRADLPGRKGLLLGAGYDSRTILAGIPDIECCYTVGTDSAPEVRVARKLSDQYGASHRTLPVDEAYFDTDIGTIRYTNGIGESIHIHQRGVEHTANVDTMYHGWGIDSLLKEFFVPKNRVGAFDKSVRLSSLDDNPDPAQFLMDKRLGIMGESGRLLDACGVTDGDPGAFLEDRIERELDRCRDRCERPHDLPSAFGIKNLPSKAFRMQLADQFLESFLCADRELIEWHLRTPPEHRSAETFLGAIQRLDADIMQHRPPDRPRTSSVLNQIEGFLRRNLHGLQAFGNPWPDRERVYEEHDLDGMLFPDSPELRSCSVRFKLRVHDAVTWLNTLAEGSPFSPEGILDPPAERQVTPRPIEGQHAFSDQSS